MLALLLISGILGLLFGSLSTVLTDRWHKRTPGILMGRSECPVCHHKLSPLELIPLVSYLLQGGKCRHCKTSISKVYPLSEGLMASIFLLLSYVFLRDIGEAFSLAHICLLSLGFITGVYMIYDIRYMEIPDQIMVPGIFIYLALLIAALFFGDISALFFDRNTYTGNIYNYVKDHILAAWILYSFFYLQILLPGSYYLIKKRNIRGFIELVYTYVLFPFLLLLPGKKDEKEDTNDEIPTWIGGGDLRIALFIGLTLGIIHGISSFAFAYILGSIYAIGLLIFSRAKFTETKNQVPFGPFLGLGWILSVFFHTEILQYAQTMTDSLSFIIGYL